LISFTCFDHCTCVFIFLLLLLLGTLQEDEEDVTATATKYFLSDTATSSVLTSTSPAIRSSGNSGGGGGDSDRGLSKQLFSQPGQTNSSILRRRNSHREQGGHQSSWVPVSKRGQRIQRDEAGLFSRISTANKINKTNKTSGGGSGASSNVAWPVAKHASPTNTNPSNGSNGSDSSNSSSGGSNGGGGSGQDVLLARLVEYEHELAHHSSEKKQLLRYIEQLKHGTRQNVVVPNNASPTTNNNNNTNNNGSSVCTERTVIFDTALGIAIGVGNVVGVVDTGTAAATAGIVVGDSIVAVGWRENRY
jgi:hypothetical protein